LLQAGYRSNGLRAWKNTANGTTYFLYDGHRLVCEFDGGGTLKNTNVWGANGLLARQNGTTLTNYVWDDRGNIVQSLNADGSVASNFNVSSWGDVTRDSGTADVYAGLGGQFGNYLDVETGLTLCGQRYYDSSAGRWINRDPISYAGGLNVYGYVGNNPTNFVDPSGLMGFEHVPPGFPAGRTDGNGGVYWSTPPCSSSNDGNSGTGGLIPGMGAVGGPPGWPVPPSNIPGGPWNWKPMPNLKNGRPGEYRGPYTKPSSTATRPNEAGDTPSLTYSQPGEPGGGTKGYWKLKQPGEPWQRFTEGGAPLTPGQVHDVEPWPASPGSSAPVEDVNPSIGGGIGKSVYDGDVFFDL